MTSSKFKFPGVFVSATDTSVGKTTLAAGLVGFLKREGFDVGVMKPVASGAIETESGRLISQDAEMLVNFAGATDPWHYINPYCLTTPVTPALAAQIEGICIDFEKIRMCFDEIARRHDFVVVEGAGGVMTPIFEQRLILDLIEVLELPAIIVSRASLGTINHTLMSFECLKARNLRAVGFFLNRFPKSPNLAERTNAEIIASASGVTHLGSIPELGDFFSQQDIIENFSKSIERDKLLEALRE
jgi:dethiobiotin synthetase